jgi:hypothetical protein
MLKIKIRFKAVIRQMKKSIEKEKVDKIKETFSNDDDNSYSGSSTSKQQVKIPS